MKILVNNEVLDCTPDEESKILEERANATEEQAAAHAAWQSEQDAKQGKIDSAKSKLESLGLTADEVKEAFGI